MLGWLVVPLVLGIVVLYGATRPKSPPTSSSSPATQVASVETLAREVPVIQAPPPAATYVAPIPSYSPPPRPRRRAVVFSCLRCGRSRYVLYDGLQPWDGFVKEAMIKAMPNFLVSRGTCPSPEPGDDCSVRVDFVDEDAIPQGSVERASIADVEL